MSIYLQCFIPVSSSKSDKNVENGPGPKELDVTTNDLSNSDANLIDHNITQYKRPPSESSISFKVCQGITLAKFKEFETLKIMVVWNQM